MKEYDMKPPFSITNNMLNQIVEISKEIGHLEFQMERNLKMRKENRIKSIHSSLAIENNSLTIEQITDIIDGKRVLGNPKEIKEVKNAYDVYDEILALNPYSQKDFLHAHALLTKDMIQTSGTYRNKDVGIFDGAGNVVHMGARPQFIQILMDDLFSWGVKDTTPEIIKSCVFHYELETIHPFEDGNGRMGRLWQTVMLSNWNPIFAWIPIETMIFENQEGYYQSLSISDQKNDSSSFIEFMLDIIIKTLKEYKANVHDEVNKEINSSDQTSFRILEKYLKKHHVITTAIASKLLKKSVSTTRRYLTNFVEAGLLESSGENKNRSYKLK